jgi:hypothetical protein
MEIRLKVVCRAKGCRIESVPWTRLQKAESRRRKSWRFEDDFLILEAY